MVVSDDLFFHDVVGLDNVDPMLNARKTMEHIHSVNIVISDSSKASSPPTSNVIVPVKNAWLIPCNIAPTTPCIHNINKECFMPEVHPSMINRMMVPYSQFLSREVWPSLVQVEEMDSIDYSPPAGSPNYLVQSPVEYPLLESESEKQKSPVNDARQEETIFSTRNEGRNMENVMERAVNLTRKRNVEGNSSSSPHVYANSLALLSDFEIVSCAFLMGVNIPFEDFESINLI